jgi:hypothetical protein
MGWSWSSRCSIRAGHLVRDSTAAMDDLKGRRDVKPDQRVEQFIRLRGFIEERASRKFLEEPVQTSRPLVYYDQTISKCLLLHVRSGGSLQHRDISDIGDRMSYSSHWCQQQLHANIAQRPIMKDRSVLRRESHYWVNSS